MDIRANNLSADTIKLRRNTPEVADRVIFAVRSLYGLSNKSVRLPLNEEESIDSGQICMTLDPEVDEAGNIGLIDYIAGNLKVKYGVHSVFPGLNELAAKEELDPSLLAPVRAVATDECTLDEDFSGWRAVGRLDFLPGSVWAGAGGG